MHVERVNDKTVPLDDAVDVNKGEHKALGAA
jgi:hypothetical protein